MTEATETPPDPNEEPLSGTDPELTHLEEDDQGEPAESLADSEPAVSPEERDA